MKREKSPRVAFYTLGCKLNYAETEAMAQRMRENGYEVVDFKENADYYVINTCSVTQQAEKKCRQTINKLNNSFTAPNIALIGCYAQLASSKLASLSGVNIVLGTQDKFTLPTHIENHLGNRVTTPEVHRCAINEVHDFDAAFTQAGRTRAFLKVQDGCNYHCAYCTIPLARGESRNPRIDSLKQQAEKIAKAGIQEIVLTGVNIGDFGQTTNETMLDLLKTLEQVEGIERMRVSSVEPNLMTSDIIDFISQSSKFLPHFHIPLQSGSDAILKAMQRRYNTQIFQRKIEEIKTKIPNAFIGVDVIVGFPGETDELFEEAYQFMKALPVSFFHVFSYSDRPNTQSIELPNKVPPQIIQKRSKIINELAAEKQRTFYESQLETEEVVLFEKANKNEWMHGYTRNYIKVETPYRQKLAGTLQSVILKEIAPSGDVKIDMLTK